ncbi:MAG: hypothetical protein FJ096_07040, partial [Deltaproteobacteria bacterium]|nr:hypothetical protein [Deltaproteobacteria bacterium]
PSYGVCSGVHADCAGDTPICATCQCVNITQCTEIQKKTVCSNTCVDTLTDPKHCGGCGMACGVDKKCANGVCISGDCPVGQTACDGSCANLQTDAKNCGSCGSACKLGEVCDGGVCASTCTLPTQPCGTSCVDVSKDPKNCGACGTACASGQVCASDANGNASCLTSCPSGLTDCGGACVDLRKDFNHCGSCGNSCNDDNVCTADSCTFGEQGGQCDNVSGAKLCPGADKPCEESKCDPKLGCVSKPLSAAAIVAGCSFAPNIPSGWSSDDVSNKQAYCLWCNPLAASTAQACVFSEREDEYGCTIDACDPKRLAGPSHGKDNTYCQKQQANTQCCAESLAAGTGCAKTCP